MSTKQKTITLKEILAREGIETASEYKLILWNDDVNSFDHVILCLVSIMKFTPEKAENTAWEVHLKGKSIIKTGSSKDELKPYKVSLEENALTLSIEK